MKDWHKVTGTQEKKPEEIDRTSSKTTVYLRRNIKQTKQQNEDGEQVKVWQYEEQEMSVEEYEQMLLMQSVVEAKTTGIVESVTEFQREAVIDEYTEQLIEEGLI